MTLLRRLNETGLAQLADFLASLTTDSPQTVPTGILTDPATSEELGVAIEIEPRTFGSRLEAARYLDGKFAGSGLRDTDRDRGLWAWLALYYFDELCPVTRRGQRDPGEFARYLLEPTKARRYYKHLLAGPYLIYRAHRDNPERALVFLFGPLHELSEFTNQLAARQETATNKAIVQALTALYIDAETGRPKYRARSKGKGGPRRMAIILSQFDVTWDLYSLSTDSFLRMLPAEFEQFKADVPTPTLIDGR